MKKGIFLIPSIFTLCNMGFGLYSIICSLREKYTMAAWLILIAIVMDGFDGFIARSAKATSRMGLEMDSFADFVSFCLAPAMLMYSIILWNYGTNGLMVLFVFITFGMLRLARYNVKAHERENLPPEKRTSYFEGLPVPAAAGILTGLVLSFEIFERFEQGITRKAIPILINRMPFIFHSIPVLMIILSFLMISKIRYEKINKIEMSRQVALRTLVLIFTAILLIIVYPENMIFIIFLFYVISGLIGYFIRIYSLRRKKINCLEEEKTDGIEENNNI